MVLANEEVAKWCHNNTIPFLSRVHGLPGNEQTEVIQEILRKNSIAPIIAGHEAIHVSETQSTGSPHSTSLYSR